MRFFGAGAGCFFAVIAGSPVWVLDLFGTRRLGYAQTRFPSQVTHFCGICVKGEFEENLTENTGARGEEGKNLTTEERGGVIRYLFITP